MSIFPVSGPRPGGTARGLLPLCLVPALLCGLLEFTSAMSLSQVLVDILAAAVGTAACVMLGRRRADARPKRAHLGLLAAPVAAIVLIAVFSGSYLPWAIASAWVLVVAAGVVSSRLVGPVDAVIVIAVAVAAIGSPLLVTRAEDSLLYALAITVPVVTSIGIGLLVRSHRRQLVAERSEALAKERTAMAHELHDVIAHEITGMVVLAQAGAMASDGATKSTFSHIEQSGRRALVDVRSMVSTLREPGASERVTVGDAGGASSLRREFDEIVDRFAASTAARVSLDVDDAVDSAEIGPRATLVALRVLTEGLTNIRRHAADAEHVAVTAGLDGTRALTVSVTDDGSGAGGLGSGNGVGLDSLDSRVTEIGGTLSARPLPRRGFELRATLPPTGKDSA